MGKLTVNKVKAALIEHHGIILKAAEACGVARQTLFKYMESHPELREVQAEAKERLLDVGEGHLAKIITEGTDGQTLRWYMERIGKNRGYSTRSEVTGADGEPLAPTVIRREVIDPEGDGGE